MAFSNPFSRRLYLRIWLAVVGGVAVLTLVVGWAWRMAAEQNAQTFSPPSRELVLRNAQGDIVVRGLATRQRMDPGEGSEYRIEAESGESFSLQMAPRSPRPDRQGRPGAPAPHGAAFWCSLVEQELA